MLIKRLIEVRENCSKEQFSDILEATIDDIKFNRIAFKKKTSQDEFIEILNIVTNVVISSY